MPRTAVVPQDISRAGLAPTSAAPDVANGNQVVNDGSTFLYVKNTGGGACTISIKIPRTVDGVAVPDKTVVVPATTGERYIGPFGVGDYNQADGSVYYDASTATGVTVAALRLPRY
jgi:hypothetical protein